MYLERTMGKRRVDRDHRLELVELELDRRRAGDRRGFGLGSHERNRIADEADDVARENRLVLRCTPPGPIREVPRGQHLHDAVDGIGAVNLNGAEPPSRNGRADERQVQESRWIEILGVNRCASDLSGGVRASDRLPEACHRAPPWPRLLVAVTASMIDRYPVQRHRFPSSASRTASGSTGSARSLRNETAITTIPGVHAPHWTASRVASSSARTAATLLRATASIVST